MRLALHFYLYSVIFESFQPILKYPYIPAAKAEGIFLLVIIAVRQESAFFLRISLTCGNSLRIFCGHRRHVATVPAFFAETVDECQ